MYSSSLDFWYKKGRAEAMKDKINETLKPFINKDREQFQSDTQLLYESTSVFNKEDIPIFNWKDLNHKTLTMHVTETREGLSVIGWDEETGIHYVIKCEVYKGE